MEIVIIISFVSDTTPGITIAAILSTTTITTGKRKGEKKNLKKKTL